MQNILNTIKDLNKWRKDYKGNINFVPTMGNLHLGHKFLIESASKLNQNKTLVSIFVNPLQFDNLEDFKNYPKSASKDIENAFSSGANAIFIPSYDEIFPKKNEPNFLKASKQITSTLCGAKRPGHFDGVCRAVYRLLNIVNPEIMILGEKDWQQILILKEMIKSNNMKIRIETISTKRELDGFPYSSRNIHLSSEERRKMQLFSQELENVKEDYKKNKNLDLKKILLKLKRMNISIDYLEHVNAFDLQKTTNSDNITMLAGAILFNKARLIDHVFLMKRKPIITVDGPAGSGKSTVTKILAKELNLLYLDTGAMYRALSWFLIKEKINFRNNFELKESLKNISIIFQNNSQNEQNVFINDYCVTNKIRSPEISSIVSSIASIKEVRKFLVAEQRKIGTSGGLVAEGRDTGTKVFPDSELKIFLTASIDERALRRKLELEQKGYGEIKFNELKNEIIKRDFDDSNRPISPLIKAKDAIEIITDGYSIKEIVQKIIIIYNDKIPKEILS